MKVVLHYTSKFIKSVLKFVEATCECLFNIQPVIYNHKENTCEFIMNYTEYI